MSNEKDYSVSGYYEFQGKKCPYIIPKNNDGLIHALRAKEKIQKIMGQSTPDDYDYFFEALKEQDKLITAYITEVGTFDNSILINNIGYLLQKENLKLGEFENLLGLSVGYISRTAKENSGKRLSIDVVWKIAKFFDISVEKLLCVNLSDLKGNTAVLMKFIEKMIKQTESGRLQWEDCGGTDAYLGQEFIDCGLISEENETLIYHPDHLNQKMKWIINADIMSTSDFDEDGKNLVIIPFCREGNDKQHYDFIFTWFARNYDIMQWQKVFYANDDISMNLVQASEALYKTIEEFLYDPKLDPATRDIIESYLEEDE